MIWSRQSTHLLTSDEGYRIVRFKVLTDIKYRASIGGQFIGEPLDDADKAKEACERHRQDNPQ